MCILEEHVELVHIFSPAVVAADITRAVRNLAVAISFVLFSRRLPVKVVRKRVVVQRTGTQNVMSDIFGCFVCRIAVLAVTYLTIMIDHLEKGYDRGSKVLWFEVMKILASNSHKALKKVAVGKCPLASALAAEYSKLFTGVVAETNLPGDIIISVDGMVRVVALTRPNSVRRIDEITPGREQFINGREVLRTLGQL
jgi:hypothetical protein